MPETTCPDCLQREVDRWQADHYLSEWKMFESEKKRFESVVQNMQSELEKYAARPDASQRAVNVKTDMINALVEFYQTATGFVSETNWHALQSEVMHIRLAADTQKLVILCKLHGMNPNMVFHYTEEELLLLWNQGARFTLPVRELALLQPDGGYQCPVYDLQPEADKKYNFLKQFCG